MTTDRDIAVCKPKRQIARLAPEREVPVRTKSLGIGNQARWDRCG
jgi:hypothetical protein